MKESQDIELSLATDQICYIIVKAREFESKAVARNDSAYKELHEFIDDLNEDQQIDLVALAWVGRGDFGLEDWAEAQQAAADARSGPTSEYLLGMPLLPDYLEDALSDMDRSCEGEELGRL